MLLVVSALMTSCLQPDREAFARALLVKALSQHRAGRTSEGIRLLRKATDMSPQSAELRYWCAVMNFETGSLDEALDCTLNGLSLQPDDARLLEMEGDILMRTGERRRAADSYGSCVQALKQKGLLGYWEPWLKLARAQLSLGMASEARATYEEVLILNPGLAEAQEALDRLRARRCCNG